MPVISRTASWAILAVLAAASSAGVIAIVAPSLRAPGSVPLIPAACENGSERVNDFAPLVVTSLLSRSVSVGS